MVEGELPFGPRTAQRLVKVVSDPRLSNATHGSLLPLVLVGLRPVTAELTL
jgi:hypothetical protein